MLFLLNVSFNKLKLYMYHSFKERNERKRVRNNILGTFIYVLRRYNREIRHT